MAWSNTRKISTGTGLVSLGALGYGAYLALTGKMALGVGIAAAGVGLGWWSQRRLSADADLTALGFDADKFDDPCAYAAHVRQMKLAASFGGKASGKTAALREQRPEWFSVEMATLLESCAAS